MTRADDVERLIAEEAATPSERRALEEIAYRVRDALSAEVPYRPAFRAELRRRLMAEARQQLVPWYRRRAFLSSVMAVAAAAVFLIALNLWQNEEGRINPPLPQPPEEVAGSQEAPPRVAQEPEKSFLVSALADVPVLTIPDEQQNAGTGWVETFGNQDGSGLLQLKRLTARPDREQFRAMADRLAFRGEGRRTERGWTVTEGSRTLTLTDDGKVDYTDTNPEPPAGGGAIDADGAREAANRFLEQAVLPIPTLQPAVTPSGESFDVVYTEEVEGRPVVNARTVVRVTKEGAVQSAEAYVSSGVDVQGTYTALTAAEAIAEATRRGGRFEKADLVWVRTPGESYVYLQPYWRVFGYNARGDRILRYIPALKR